MCPVWLGLVACSICRRMGHKKPNCPIVKEENERNQDQAIAILSSLPPLLANPLVIASIWLFLTKMSPRINMLNNIIAIGELIPTIDLGVPKGVVLGAMIDKTDDAIDVWNDIRDFLEDYELPRFPTREEIIEEYVTDPTLSWWERKKKQFEETFGGPSGIGSKGLA